MVEEKKGELSSAEVEVICKFGAAMEKRREMEEKLGIFCYLQG